MKKNLIVAAFLISISVFSIITLLNIQSKEGINSKEAYIEECMSNLESLNTTKQIKSRICDCSYDYLFNKYGEDKPKNKLVAVTRIDSLAMIDCMIVALGADSLTSEDVLKQLQEN